MQFILSKTKGANSKVPDFVNYEFPNDGKFGKKRARYISSPGDRAHHGVHSSNKP